MKRIISILLTVVFTIMLASCSGSGNASKEYVAPTTFIEQSSENTDIDTTESNLPSHEGILGAYVADYNEENFCFSRIALAWINPSTGSTSLYKEFCNNDDDIAIDPNDIMGNYNSQGKTYIRQMFDESFDRIIAKRMSDNSWGWMDTNGQYTAITTILPSNDGYYRQSRGLCFYKGFYYISCKSYSQELHEEYSSVLSRWQELSDSGKIYSDEGQRINSEMIDLIAKINDAADYKVYKIPAEDIDFDKAIEVEIYQKEHIGDNFTNYEFLIQSDDKTELAFIYTEWDICPIFCEEINGHCVTPRRYSDWISAEKSICDNRNGKIEVFNSIYLGDSLFSEKNEELSDGEFILESSEKEYTTPILNIAKDSFACVVWDITVQGNKTTKKPHLGIYSLTGEEINSFSYSELSTPNGDTRLRKLLDWQ